jgi:hypothetical protein
MAGLKTHDALLIRAIVHFMKKEISIPNVKITIKRKDKQMSFGDVVMNDNSVNKNKFTVHWNPNQSKRMMIQSLIHELTHVKQIAKKELQPGPDYKSLYWKGKEYITVRELKKKMKNVGDYMKLPWEKEAYGNMKPLYNKFLKSKQWEDLKCKDPNLDYIIQNI